MAFLEIAPWLIVVFSLDHEPERLADGTERPHKNYYVQVFSAIRLPPLPPPRTKIPPS
jgi:hypothetical protein